MIHARRTAYTEQPDGSLTCQITIAAADRLALLNGEAIELPAKPTPKPIWMGIDLAAADVASEAVMAAVTSKHAAALASSAMSAIKEGHGCLKTSYSVDEGFDVQHVDHIDTVTFHDEAESADRPPTQTVAAGGFEASEVMAAVAAGEYQWDHPAAPHMATIYRHSPFQQFALRELHADAFAAPMESATRIITQAVQGVPMDVAVTRLGKLMDRYGDWAAIHGLPMWPEG